ncbi:MAG: DNA-binding protein WhiA [Bacilli bacterium]|nr:DNA-binding protein WhiA [Bacilli bacterium]
MSFTTTVKNEICKIESKKIENITELSAIIRNIGIIDSDIKVQTENAAVARRIYTLLKDTFNISPKIVVRRGYNFNKNYIYIIIIDSKVDNIIENLELKNIVPKEYLYSDDDLIRAYFRGLFLSVGSINDPKKSRYHLEFMVSSKTYATFVSELLNKFDLNSKVLKRENRYMVYVKEAEKIGDFLRLIQAMNALFYFEDIRIYRDHKNMTNRLNNCEQANVDKIIDSANKQIKDIEKIESINALDLLDDKTKEAAIYRKKYPEVSLAELGEIISIETGNKITKSGLYHRFKKIKDMADRIKE